MDIFSDQRPTRADIDLANLTQNFHSVKNFVGKNVQYMAVVKADAYGHGAPQCAQTLEKAGVDWFGVALPEEGLELRRAGLTRPILCLGSFWPGQVDLLIQNDLTPTLFQMPAARALNAAAVAQNRMIDVHIKIDTGMGRVGVRHDRLEDFVRDIKSLKNLRVDGLMTHFAAADDLEENDFTRLQIERFQKAADIVAKSGLEPTYFDLANSPGAVAHKDAPGNMVRLGGILYGLGGDVLPKNIAKPELLPVMSLRSAITLLKRVPKGESLGYGRTFFTERDSLIATVPIGYNDGYRRSLSNLGKVLVRGEFAPVVGRISMDWTLVDVTDVENVQVGDEVVLIGRQGANRITAECLAASLDTISYEITCGISSRVPRSYVNRAIG